MCMGFWPIPTQNVKSDSPSMHNYKKFTSHDDFLPQSLYVEYFLC